MNIITNLDAAYTAGLADEEGSLRANCYRRRTRGETRGQQYGNGLRIRFADEKTIRWLQEIFGIGCVYPESNGRYQTMWNWQVSGKQCAEVLKVIFPYLRTKKRQAELIFELRERIEAYKQPRDARGRGLPIDEEENKRRLAIIEEIHRLNRPNKNAKQKQAPRRFICVVKKGVPQNMGRDMITLVDVATPSATFAAPDPASSRELLFQCRE